MDMNNFIHRCPAPSLIVGNAPRDKAQLFQEAKGKIFVHFVHPENYKLCFQFEIEYLHHSIFIMLQKVGNILEIVGTTYQAANKGQQIEEPTALFF
jgi:hypothetical protein